VTGSGPFDYKERYGGKRYHSYNTYLKKKYGERVQKVTVDAGFTCPNRDGTVASGGCIYCNNESFNPGYNDPTKSVRQQIDEGTEFLRRRYNVDKFMVYFQPYSNTYASLDTLKQLYEDALSASGIIGLTIGTRPDCIDEEKLDYLESLAKTCDITIEYGLESIYDDSLKKINRGHDYQCYLDAIEMTKNRGINICTHIILGFPWENREQWMYEAEVLSEIAFDFLKIHQLHIVKNTVLERNHIRNPYRLFTLTEYVDTVVSFLEKLNPEIIIQRLAGEAPKKVLVAPKWGKRNSEVITFITNELEKRNTWQGKKYVNL
jgi:radical SAM protein (TIGR01212 family)